MNFVIEGEELIVDEDGKLIVVEQYDVVKIFKGEESNFVWSVFFILFEEVVLVLNIVEVGD